MNGVHIFFPFIVQKRNGKSEKNRFSIRCPSLEYRYNNVIFLQLIYIKIGEKFDLQIETEKNQSLY
uniref:Uncharacterized protein n=1 Tax=Lepeophtheirus salmonis TaxID=72036 RepID=A0A0K2UC38_LEPSM